MGHGDVFSHLIVSCLYKHTDFVPRNQGNWETGNVASMPTLYLDQIANHNQSEKSLSLFLLLRMFLLALLRCSSTRQTEASRCQIFYFGRSNPTKQTHRKGKVRVLRCVHHLESKDAANKMRDVTRAQNQRTLHSPCDLAWLSRTFPVQIVAVLQA